MEQRPIEWQGIVKIQRPLVTTANPAQALVYAEDEELICFECDLSEVIFLFKANEYKIFHYATVRKGGHITIERRAEWQDW